MTKPHREPGWKIPPAQLLDRHHRREKLSLTDRKILDERLLQETRSGNATQVNNCLIAGACPDARDRHGNSALMHAARGGHPDTARALLQGWATPNFANNDDSPITLAVAFGRTNTAVVIREYLPPVLDAATEASIRAASNETPRPSRSHIQRWINQNLRKPDVLAS